MYPPRDWLGVFLLRSNDTGLYPMAYSTIRIITRRSCNPSELKLWKVSSVFRQMFFDHIRLSCFLRQNLFIQPFHKCITAIFYSGVSLPAAVAHRNPIVMPGLGIVEPFAEALLQKLSLVDNRLRDFYHIRIQVEFKNQFRFSFPLNTQLAGGICLVLPRIQYSAELWMLSP